ncbi:MAG TPA: membrane protein insertase YidC [Terracidiphilus sp.]|nr:membrane protein insertase YidC [Terracidiphilus sp.]
MPEFKNPSLESQGPGASGPGGGDFRSLLTFMFLAIALFLAFQYFKPGQSSTSPQAPAPQPSANSSQSAPPPAAPVAAATTASAKPDATPNAVAASETETTVENELYRIVFTNRGAQVKSWILKKYYDTSGKPLDLIQPQLAERFGLPLSLYTYEQPLTTDLNQSLYQASTTGTLLAPGTLTFHYAQGGLDVTKTIRFDSSYVVGITVSVRRNGAPVRALVTWPAGLGDMEEFLPSSTTRSTIPTQSQLVTSIDGKQDNVSAAKVSGNATYEQPYDYAAVSDLYFAVAFLPDPPARASLVTFHNSFDVLSDLSNPSSQKKPDPVLGIAMGDVSGDTRLRLFVGPKQTDVLKTIFATGPDGKANGPSLDSLIQYGWWGIIAKPLYLALRWLHNLLGQGSYNWGWAIIIVTVIFNLVLLPTRFMMMRSSLRMMRIQPKVDAIKKRYSHLKINDPKRNEMNSEMMQLYKDEGVNMYGGCLPLVLQMPLFFAYYRVLLNAVELRQAHWFWLNDLSAPDPTHVLPGLIILTMFLTQYITPSPGMDPAQRRMMAFVMPIMMGFILWHYASGLALYWITGNLINLAIQVGINQSSMGKEMHAIAARRAQKKSSGAGQRVIQGRR